MSPGEYPVKTMLQLPEWAVTRYLWRPAGSLVRLYSHTPEGDRSRIVLSMACSVVSSAIVPPTLSNGQQR